MKCRYCKREIVWSQRWMSYVDEGGNICPWDGLNHQPAKPVSSDEENPSGQREEE